MGDLLATVQAETSAGLPDPAAAHAARREDQVEQGVAQCGPGESPAGRVRARRGLGEEYPGGLLRVI